jgi:hypothetical protein
MHNSNACLIPSKFNHEQSMKRYEVIQLSQITHKLNQPSSALVFCSTPQKEEDCNDEFDSCSELSPSDNHINTPFADKYNEASPLFL